MSEKAFRAEVVQSGLWVYDHAVTQEVWIVQQNFDFHHDEGFEDGTENLNVDGEVFQVLFIRDRVVASVGAAEHTLSKAIEAAERVVPRGIEWTNHLQQTLFGGRRYSLQP